MSKQPVVKQKKAALYRILVPVVQNRSGSKFHEQGDVVSLSWCSKASIRSMLECHEIEEVK